MFVLVGLEVGGGAETLVAVGAGVEGAGAPASVVVVVGVVLQRPLRHEPLAAQVADELLLHVLRQRVEASALLGRSSKSTLINK